MLSSVNYVNIYLFSIFFFNRFCPMVKCRVTLHCLYCDSLTLRFHNYLSIYRDIAHLTCQISQQTFLVFQDVFKISWKRLQRNIFLSPKTSSRRLHEHVLQLFLEDVLEDKKMLHWRRLQDVFSTPSPRWCLLGFCLHFIFHVIRVAQISFEKDVIRSTVSQCLCFQSNCSLFINNETDSLDHSTNKLILNLDRTVIALSIVCS